MNLASRGLRDMDTGPEKITDDAELARVRSQAMRVHVRGLIAAAVVTAIVVALPL